MVRRDACQAAVMLLNLAGPRGAAESTVLRTGAPPNGPVVHDSDEIGVPAGADTQRTAAGERS
ncbi:hypothetical protein Apa02nite_033340 [Actinoplanes palleronii]|uniref:Uncharacterized protein n=2 Tax=Actinoplanes palleronii TaxID=113570 RepID=A0ABQ4BA05_9ACTN|nr:hypothetical protein Apa02nite_033340 [Actinoplanes palleronii]